VHVTTGPAQVHRLINQLPLRLVDLAPLLDIVFEADGVQRAWRHLFNRVRSVVLQLTLRLLGENAWLGLLMRVDNVRDWLLLLPWHGI
jgi:hypothetical protein